MTGGLEENKQIVRQFLHGIVDGDLNILESLLHPDVVWWIIGVGNLDRATLIGGLKSLIAAQSRTMKVTALIAEGDWVAFEAEGEMVYPAKVYRNRYHNSFRVQGSKIVEGREYLDTRAVEVFMAM